MAAAVTIQKILPFKTNTHGMLNRKRKNGVLARKCDYIWRQGAAAGRAGVEPGLGGD